VWLEAASSYRELGLAGSNNSASNVLEKIVCSLCEAAQGNPKKFRITHIGTCF
jgi:hypothetical protein